MTGPAARPRRDGTAGSRWRLGPSLQPLGPEAPPPVPLGSPGLRGTAAPAKLVGPPLLMAGRRADGVRRGGPVGDPGGGCQVSFPDAFRTSTIEPARGGGAGSQDPSPLSSQCLRISSSKASLPGSTFPGAEPNQALEDLVNVIAGTAGPQGLQGSQVGDESSGLQVAAVVVTEMHVDDKMTIALKKSCDLRTLPKT